MALVVPDVGEVIMLESIFKTASPSAHTLKLYQNDISPAESDTAGTYTEATISGYSSVSLTRATWNAASTDGGGVTTITYPQTTFTFSGSGTIVGYYIINTTGGVLNLSERIFSTPGQSFISSDQLKLTLSVALA